MFTMFTMFIYITIMIKFFSKVLVISGLVLAFTACRTTKETETKKVQEEETDVRQEEFDNLYDEHH